MIFHDENPFEPKAVGGRRRKPGTLSDEALDLIRELSMIGGKHGRCVWRAIMDWERGVPVGKAISLLADSARQSKISFPLTLQKPRSPESRPRR